MHPPLHSCSPARRIDTDASCPNGHTPAMRSAFTLVELLGAMTVLLLILSIMATLLGESGRLWRMGTDRNRHLSGARATLDMIATDLQQAVANSNLVFYITSSFQDPPNQDDPFEILGFPCDEIFFYRIVATPRTPADRSIERVWYGADLETDRNGRIREGRLIRKTQALPADATPPVWPELSWPDPTPQEIEAALGDLAAARPAPLLDRLAGIRFSAEMPDGTAFYPPDDGTLSAAYTNALPAYVDIYLELLTPAEIRRAAGLPPNRQADFVDRHVIRLTRRVTLNPVELP